MEASAPQGWTLTLDSFSLGDVAPTLTGWQVYNNAETGQVDKVTADFSLDSSSLTMGLTGTGPFVGVFVGMWQPDYLQMTHSVWQTPLQVPFANLLGE